MSGLDNIKRALDELGPDYPEAVVRLVDALRDYLHADSDLTQDLLREGSITADEAKQDPEGIIGMACKLLAVLENWEVDMTLHGVITYRRPQP